MKQLKILLTALLLSSVLFIADTRAAHAVDLTITCAFHGPCETVPGGSAALFNSTNMLPGDTVLQTITVFNEDEENECRNLELTIEKTSETPDTFADIIYAAIVKDSADLFGTESGGEALNDATFQDLYDQTTVNLGSVPAAGSSTIDWYATFEKLAGNEYQEAITTFDFDIYFECNSFEEEPELTIAKFNDQWPNAVTLGSTVNYSIVITAIGGSPIYNVQTTDAPPEGFSYQSGSWAATKNGSPFAIPEPTYASPGVWQLGDMEPGDVVVLTYNATVGTSNEPGLFKDMAWAYGCSDNSPCSISDVQAIRAESVDSTKSDPGIITDNHVGTKIPVTDDPASGEYDVEKEKESDSEGDVLGVSATLPATGASVLIVLCAVVLIGFGTLLVYKDNKKKL